MIYEPLHKLQHMPIMTSNTVDKTLILWVDYHERLVMQIMGRFIHF